MKAKVVAIDGPSGSGKSTIAKLLAEKLNLTYLDTGAMYRGIAYILKKNEIAVESEAQIESALENMTFEYGVDKETLIKINGDNLTETIREHHVSKLASQYSQVNSVRKYLKKIQRDIATTRYSILEGRDIGTVIFPDAALKIFLTASVDVRANRRFNELADSNLSLEKIKKDIEKRDFEDENREIAPLKKADDAIEIDTSNMSIDEIVKKITILYSDISSKDKE